MDFEDDDELEDDDLDVEESPAICKNAHCLYTATESSVVILHSSGYCYSCCPILGPLECPQCGWDEDDE